MTRHYTLQDPISLTKQSFKDEVNINKIMAKFQKSGAISHYAKHAPTYGDATSTDLHTALDIIADADSMFEELPSSIRKKFENDPAKFLDFVQNPDNLEEMREIGLANPAEPGPNASDTGTNPDTTKTKTKIKTPPSSKEDSPGGTPGAAEGGIP